MAFTSWMSAKESWMEWIIVGLELGVALVIAVAVYITMKR
jgi:putative Ca2+/H+ antiporter (TMEM165/GDT1 family)